MKRLALMLAVVGLAACGDDSSSDVDMSAPDLGESQVDRGRYLVNNVGACVFCHTPLNPDGSRDNTRFLAGCECLGDIDPATPGFGCINSRNLTNDPTGLKNVTDDQIKNAFRNGVRSDGKFLSAVMPYWAFHNITDADADAIVAYLRTVPGVNHQVPQSEPPFDVVPGVVPFIDAATIPQPSATDPKHDAAMRGRYLASMAGLCIDCHTPDVQPPGPGIPIQTDKFFAGNRIFPVEQLGFTSPPYPMMIATANLTNDATGLAGWTIDQIKSAIKDGKDRDGKTVCAATHGLTTSPYAGLTDADVTDIATYLTTIPGINNARMDCQGP